MKYLFFTLIFGLFFNCSNQITDPLDSIELIQSQPISYYDDGIKVIPEIYKEHQCYSTVELFVTKKNDSLFFSGSFLLPNPGYIYSHIITYIENKFFIIEVYGKVDDKNYSDVIAKMSGDFQILDPKKSIIIRSITEDYIVKDFQTKRLFGYSNNLIH